MISFFFVKTDYFISSNHQNGFICPAIKVRSIIICILLIVAKFMLCHTQTPQFFFAPLFALPETYACQFQISCWLKRPFDLLQLPLFHLVKYFLSYCCPAALVYVCTIKKVILYPVQFGRYYLWEPGAFKLVALSKRSRWTLRSEKLWQLQQPNNPKESWLIKIPALKDEWFIFFSFVSGTSRAF